MWLLVVGFNGTVCVRAQGSRLGTILNSDREAIPPKVELSAQRIIELEGLGWVLPALGQGQVLSQH